eukprot:2135980-Alexandrium_andersonii.AAC.1
MRAEASGASEAPLGVLPSVSGDEGVDMPLSHSSSARASPMEGSAEAPAVAVVPSAPRGVVLRCPISSKAFHFGAKPCRGPTSWPK